MSDETDDRFRALCEQISGDVDRYPHLDEALFGLDQNWLRPVLVRPLDCGWALEDIESVLARLVPKYSGSLYRALAASAIIQVIHDAARLGPTEFDAWLAVYGLKLVRTDMAANTLAEIEVWLACVPGPLARACIAAGLSLAETRDLQNAGRLNPQTVEVLAALRNLHTG